MKKYFTAVTILAFAALLVIGGSALADETRAQFERSSREKATVGLFSDTWDDFIDFPWLSGTLENENYLWTNLANVQSDNVHAGPVNKTFRDDGYSWSTDEKEDILGNPASWDSNNSFAFGYLGNPVASEGWNMGFVYNYQTFDYHHETDNSSYNRNWGQGYSYNNYNEDWTILANDSYDMVEHLWMLNGGIVLSEELGIGFSWYHWNNDHEWRTSRGSKSWGNNINGHYSYEQDEYHSYNLEEQGDTLSFGAFFQLDDDLAVTGYLDIDYNQTEILWQNSVVTHTGASDSEGESHTNEIDYSGNEDRDDFGFDLMLNATKAWNGDFWERTEFYLWVGWHPEDGEYWGSSETINYEPWSHSVNYDADGTIAYDELNWGFDAQSFINFGDRVHFAWGISFKMLDCKYNLNYDWVWFPGTTASSNSDHSYDVEYDVYYWSFPVALEVDFLKYLTGRVGARWSLADYDGIEHTGYEADHYIAMHGGSPDQEDSYEWWDVDNDINTDSKTSSTVYSFGLGWAFNEYLQIDLTEFTDLDTMEDWQLSLTLKW